MYGVSRAHCFDRVICASKQRATQSFLLKQKQGWPGVWGKKDAQTRTRDDVIVREINLLMFERENWNFLDCIHWFYADCVANSRKIPLYLKHIYNHVHIYQRTTGHLLLWKMKTVGSSRPQLHKHVLAMSIWDVDSQSPPKKAKKWSIY